jgi:hypothetical protein
MQKIKRNKKTEKGKRRKKKNMKKASGKPSSPYQKSARGPSTLLPKRYPSLALSH